MVFDHELLEKIIDADVSILIECMDVDAMANTVCLNKPGQGRYILPVLGQPKHLHSFLAHNHDLTPIIVLKKNDIANERDKVCIDHILRAVSDGYRIEKGANVFYTDGVYEEAYTQYKPVVIIADFKVTDALKARCACFSAINGYGEIS